MRRRRFLAVLLLATAAPFRAAESADAMEEFRARHAQAVWNLQVLDGIVRPMPEPDRERPTPPVIAAYGRLLTESIGALEKIDLSAATDEMRRQAAEGWTSLARHTRDLAALARNRRLDRFAQQLTELEARCRTAILRM